MLSFGLSEPAEGTVADVTWSCFNAYMILAVIALIAAVLQQMIKNRAIIAPMSAAMAKPDGTVTDELTACLKPGGKRSIVDVVHFYGQNSART